MLKRPFQLMCAFLLLAAAAAPAVAADTRFKVWSSPREPQCAIVDAARSGSSAELLTVYEDLLQGRASKAELDRAIKPLTRLVQNRSPKSGTAYELFVLEGEISDALVIVTFSDGVKLFTHMTLTSGPGGWAFLGLNYNISWDKIKPRLSVSKTRFEPIACAGNG